MNPESLIILQNCSIINPPLVNTHKSYQALVSFDINLIHNHCLDYWGDLMLDFLEVFNSSQEGSNEININSDVIVAIDNFMLQYNIGLEEVLRNRHLHWKSLVVMQAKLMLNQVLSELRAFLRGNGINYKVIRNYASHKVSQVKVIISNQNQLDILYQQGILGGSIMNAA